MTLSANTVESAQSYDLGFRAPETSGLVLPQKLAILSPIATSKQSGFSDYNVPKKINSYAEALEEYGICPATIAMRILKPTAGGGLSSVPVYVFPVEDESGATAGAGTITPTASAAATSSNTHYVKFNGRKSIEGRSCGFSISEDDSIATIVAAITAAINGFLHTPVGATDGTTAVTLASVWKGITANKIDLEIDTNGDDCGITYVVVDPASASGAAEITGALANFGDIWYTKVLNVFGSSVYGDLATFNGIPNVETGGSGRWLNTVMKPFIAYDGTTESAEATLLALAASRTTDLTNQLCPAPNSLNYEFEAASAWIVELAQRQNSDPSISVLDATLTDITGPEDGNIGDMKTFSIRDSLVLNGVSTVTYDGSQYAISSAITFRRPVDQNPTAIDFKFDRDINLDLNVKYNYRVNENTYLKGKTLAADTDVVDGDAPVIKPKDWLAIVLDLTLKLVKKGWLADYDYTKENTSVAINGSNPNRIDTIYNYKLTGVARIMAATVYKSYNTGS